ncbi:tail assembly chaperone [Microbacterium phage ClearAsMud]|uniref:Uncharacterized protein n=2 Tax=Quhwahvirus TaxID=2733202 RepID=A0A899IR24_9CAUD|nr:tail assembly chaperone [Microbacterium phage ClearAsMud]YP_010751689.1 hypothetical protein QDA08_gp35 [Microbacterium phage NoodlelyBoi]QNL30247.1 tail assembly chaperone [Microbacterium phage ClearAsMud]QSM01230.1 hypothetical protein SEA_NOODLELYBOI_35 [Microbacterium phage NoodlelyBoi]
MQFGAFLDFVYYMLTRNGDDTAVEKFRRNLWMPPKGVAPDARSPWSPERETAAFKAVKALVTGQGPVLDASGGS